MTPGPAYFFPCFSFKEMKSAPVIEKMKRGPVGLLTVLPSGPPAMGKSMVQWLRGQDLFCHKLSTVSSEPLFLPYSQLSTNDSQLLSCW